MLSHSESSLIVDSRSLSELKQGVTTQIFGESSMGPLNDQMKRQRRESQGDVKFDIEWTTLAEYLTYLEKHGIPQNVASFIGAPTIREYVIGLEDKPPTPAQLDQMRELVRKEMEAGALGITTALIYPPAFFAKTEELIELCKVAAKYKGKYTAHMRSEGDQLIEAVQETIRISREAGLPAEIYHLKASGEANWPKMDQVFKLIEDARKQGVKSQPICIRIRRAEQVSTHHYHRGSLMADAKLLTNDFKIRQLVRKLPRLFARRRRNGKIFTC